MRKLTLKHLLESSVAKFPDRAAMARVNEEPITYASLGRRVRDITRLLEERGIAHGDRVAILSENTPHWVMVYFAVCSMGAVIVPILPDFHPDAVNHIIRHAGCKAVFVSERLYEKLDVHSPSLPETIILVDDFSLVPPGTGKGKLSEAVRAGRRELTKLRDTAMRLTGMAAREPEEDDLSAIVYTSGTTGHSKGVMLTHRNIVSNAIAGEKVGKITENDRFLSILPLSHTYECTVGMVLPLMCGASINYFDKPPTPSTLLPAMQRIRPTYMLSVPLVIEKVFKMRVLPKLTGSPVARMLYKIPMVRKKLHSIAGKKLYESFGGALVFYGVGGAALAPDVERFLKEGGFPYAIGYGMTEASPVIAGTGPAETRLRGIGPAMPGVEIRIDNPDPETGEGEIMARGPNVMKGYYKDPELTAQVLTPDGWLHTGDLGVIDKDGFLYMKGRLKNVIVGPSGENIYPEELEAMLCESIYVKECLVYETDGRILARVHPNYEKIEEDFAAKVGSETGIRKVIDDLLHRVQAEVNGRVSAYSRIHKIMEQTEPFEKTPTQKIKRFLYTSPEKK